MCIKLLCSCYILSIDSPIGMNLALIRKLLLEQAQENGQKASITAHYDVEEIYHELEQVKEDRDG